MPAQVLGKPAPHQRAHYRPKNHGHSEERHANRLLRWRQSLCDDGHGGWNKRAAHEPLTGATDDHRRQIGGNAAQHRKGREGRNRDDEQRAKAEQSFQPRAQRDDDDLGNKEGCRDPGAFGSGRADFPLDRRQRRIDDRDVKRCQHRPQRTGGYGDPGRSIGLFDRRRNRCSGACHRSVSGRVADRIELVSSGARIDTRDNRHARHQQTQDLGRSLNGYAHRDALNDLGEITRRVLWRKD